MTPKTMSTMIVVPTSPSPTAAPPIHYTPSKIANVHLEFDYPGSWYSHDEKMPYTDTIVIYLADPRVLTVPTRTPDEPHGVPSDFGNIEIWIDPIKPNQTRDSLVEEQKRINSSTWGLTLLNDYPIEIDGHDGHVLETLIDFPDLYTSVMFTRRIFFIAYDQVYTIDFAVAKQDRGGEFEQGYDYFFKSLKIVP
ncbi:MAG TPA: hypothetical protein VHP14_19600 [Anaerolineales bacterium]|nr:hypothetical protein [Anaerolineales bacterium]